MATIEIKNVAEDQIKVFEAIAKVFSLELNLKKQDETGYLLSTETNKKSLERSLQQSKEGKSTVIKTEDLWK